MKHYKNITQCLITVLVFWVYLLPQNSFGQLPLPCGGYKMDTAAFMLARNMASQNPNQMLTQTPYLIRVYFHICTLDNGTLPAATINEINSEFNNLKSDYAPFNICFLLAGIDYVNNTTIDTNFNINTGNFALYDPYKVPGCINIFYQKKILGNNSACPTGCGIGGYAFFIPSNACLISSGNIGSGQTISHEIGHCLGLFHTFETGFGYEAINGSNSFIAGDMITDTPADPFAWFSANNSCFSQSGGVYTGNCLDPNFQSNYSPPYNNLMAYWWAYGNYSPLVISQGQYNLMNTVLNNILYPDLLACKSPNNATEGPGINITSGYHEVSAVFDLTTTGSVFLGGTSQSTLGGMLVLLEPGFHADATNNGSIWIKTSECNYVPRYQSPGSNVYSNTIGLSVHPNPSKDIFNLSYHSNEDGLIKICIYNSEMKLIKQLVNEWQPTGEHQYQFNVENLSNGMYIAKLEAGGNLKTVKLVVIKNW